MITTIGLIVNKIIARIMKAIITQTNRDMRTDGMTTADTTGAMNLTDIGDDNKKFFIYI